MCGSSSEAALSFLRDVMSLLQSQLEHLEGTALYVRYGSDSSRTHGLLLFIRYILDDIPFSSWACGSSEEDFSQWRAVVKEMLDTMMTVTHKSLQLHVHSSNNNNNNKDDSTASSSSSSPPLDTPQVQGIDCRGHVVFEQTEATRALSEAERSYRSQLIVVSSWLAVKESSLALGSTVAAVLECERDGTRLVDPEMVRSIGEHLLDVLLSSKHNGVIEKAHVAFLHLNQRLLASSDPVLRSLPPSWLDGLLKGILDQAGGSDTWIRRSAGLPFCFLSILQADPSSNGDSLVTRALTRLLSMMSGRDDTEKDTSAETAPTSEVRLPPVASLAQSKKGGSTEREKECTESDAEEEKQWRVKVHCLNIVRSIFQDSSFAVDSVAFTATALRSALEGFASTNWAVRNSSLLCFTAILNRAVKMRFSSHAKTERGMTGRDFFLQFPSLHQYLLDQLQEAVSSYEQGSARSASMGDMHPSLYPILMLLSRLSPSLTTHDTESATTPTGTTQSEETNGTSNTGVLQFEDFLPLIVSCAKHNNHMARYMASKAVVALVTPSNLSSFVNSSLSLVPDAPSSDLDFNHVHGSLLQVLRVVEDALGTAGDAGKRQGNEQEEEEEEAEKSSEAKEVSPSPANTLSHSLITSILPHLDRLQWLVDSSDEECAPIQIVFLRLYRSVVLSSSASSSSSFSALDPDTRFTWKLKLLRCCLSLCRTRSQLMAVGINIGSDSVNAEAAVLVIDLLFNCDREESQKWSTCVDIQGLLVSFVLEGSEELASTALQTIVRLSPCSFSYIYSLFDEAEEDKRFSTALREVVSSVPETSLSSPSHVVELALSLLVRVSTTHSNTPTAAVVWDPSTWTAVSGVVQRCSSSELQVFGMQYLAALLLTRLEGERKNDNTSSVSLMSDSEFVSAVLNFSDLVCSLSDEERPAILRYACAVSLRRSGLLLAGSSLFASSASSPSSPSSSLTPPLTAVRSNLWEVVILLLDDCNESVRSEAASLAAEVKCSHTIANGERKTDNGYSAVPVKAISLSLSCLGDVVASKELADAFIEQEFSRLTQYWSSLALAAPIDSDPSKLETSPRPPSFTLFEKEKENPVSEPLSVLESLSLQLASSSSYSDSSLSRLLHIASVRLHHSLVAATTPSAIDLDPRFSGVSFDPEVYQATYACALVINVLVFGRNLPQGEARASVLSFVDSIDSETAIRNGQIHPSIFRLLKQDKPQTTFIFS